MKRLALAVLLSAPALPAAASEIKNIKYFQPNGVFSIDYPTPGWLNRDNEVFASYYSFVTFYPTDGSMARFKVMMTVQKAGHRRSVGETAQEYANTMKANGVARTPPVVKAMMIGGRDARKVSYMTVTNGVQGVLSYHFIVVGRYQFALVSGYPISEKGRYEATFDKLVRSFAVLHPEKLEQLFPGEPR